MLEKRCSDEEEKKQNIKALTQHWGEKKQQKKTTTLMVMNGFDYSDRSASLTTLMHSGQPVKRQYHGDTSIVPIKEGPQHDLPFKI